MDRGRESWGDRRLPRGTQAGHFEPLTELQLSQHVLRAPDRRAAMAEIMFNRGWDAFLRVLNLMPQAEMREYLNELSRAQVKDVFWAALDMAESSPPDAVQFFSRVSPDMADHYGRAIRPDPQLLAAALGEAVYGGSASATASLLAFGAEAGSLGRRPPGEMAQFAPEVPPDTRLNPSNADDYRGPLSAAPRGSGQQASRVHGAGQAPEFYLSPAAREDARRGAGAAGVGALHRPSPGGTLQYAPAAPPVHADRRQHPEAFPAGRAPFGPGGGLR